MNFVNNSLIDDVIVVSDDSMTNTLLSHDIIKMKVCYKVVKLYFS